MDNKIAERLKDRSFVEKLMGLGTPDEVKSFFKSEGLTISDDELKEMGSSLNDVISQFKDIPDVELENISGGLGNPVKYVHGKLEDAFTDLGTFIARKPGYDPEESEGEVNRVKILGAIGEHLEDKADKYATGAMAGAALIVAYAGYKKGWPAVKALGQKKGWWK